MATPRITPMEPPYPADMQAAFDKLMRGQPPLKLFRTVAHNPRVLARMMAGGLLDRGSIDIRLRELMILRITALCGAEYEWGVHVTAFGPKCAWRDEELHAVVHGPPAADCWQPEEQLVLQLADSLYATRGVDDALWEALSARFAEAQLIELTMLAGLYHAVSFLVNVTAVEHESFAAPFPTA